MTSIGDDYFKGTYDFRGRDPVAWSLKAQQLFDAAGILFSVYVQGIVPNSRLDLDLQGRAHGLLGPLLLLRGAGCECLLKALAIRRGYRLAEGGRFKPLYESLGVKPQALKDHDLVALARHLHFDLNDYETNLLGRLSLFIEAGRYPMLKRWDATPVPKVAKAVPKWVPTKYTLSWSTPGDEQHLENLVKRLADEIGE